MFPISRDPPEGGTVYNTIAEVYEVFQSFQFLGIPPKGEHNEWACPGMLIAVKFPISRDPPEGGTHPHYFVLGGFTAYPVSNF